MQIDEYAPQMIPAMSVNVNSLSAGTPIIKSTSTMMKVVSEV